MNQLVDERTVGVMSRAETWSPREACPHTPSFILNTIFFYIKPVICNITGYVLGAGVTTHDS